MLRNIFILLFGFCVISFGNTFGQAPTDSVAVIDSTLYKVSTNDGNELIGYILKQDAREVLIRTLDNKDFYVQNYAVKKIEKVERIELNNKGEFVGEDKFATRYFLTTNGLPLKKGQHYMQWNWFGPDIQFSITDRLGLGVMTTWFATPILGTAKYSVSLGKNVQGCVGAIAGSSSWLSFPSIDFRAGLILPFTSVSFGNRKSNLALSGGYGAVGFDGNWEGRFLCSLGGMTKIGKKVSLVFDSFIIPPIKRTYTNFDGTIITERRGLFALLIPGLRIHVRSGNAFQFGFNAMIVDQYAAPFPIPMLQWYRSF